MTGQDTSARAAEFALGLLEGADLEDAERSYETDEVFRFEVDMLAGRLSSLDDTAAEETPSSALWSRIEGAIAAEPAAKPSVVVGTPHPRRAPAATPMPVGRGAHRFGGMRGAAMAAGLAAALAVGYTGAILTTPVPEPVVVVVLSDENNVPGAIVEAYADDAVRIVPLAEFNVPQGKTLEVWTLYDREVGPVSLGTFDRPQEIRLSGPDQPVPQPAQLYEITLEDAPGSPIGRPTGPILVKGLAVRPPGR
jgi:anti-sigma-K factor RskA